MEAMEASMASICCDLHCMEAAEARGDSGPYNIIPQVEEAPASNMKNFSPSLFQILSDMRVSQPQHL